MPIFPRIDAGLAALTAAALVFFAILLTPAVLQDGDLYWHIAAGRWVLENTAVLRIDPFSYTFAGHPWQTQDWLAEIVMALAYIGAGWNGLLLLFAGVAALTAGLLVFHLSCWLQGPALWAVAATALLCAAGAVLGRPYLLALPFAEIWIAGLVAARAENRAPSFTLLAAMVLWANLQAGFLLGLGLAVLFALEAAGKGAPHRFAAARPWIVFLAFALLASLVTPYGLDGLSNAIRQAPRWPSPGQNFVPLVAAAAAVLLLALRRVPVPPLRAAVLAVLLALAVMQPYGRLLFAAAAPLLLAGALGRALQSEGIAPRWRPLPLLCFVLAMTAAAALRFVLPVTRADDAYTPASALAQLPAPLLRAPVLNDLAFGGYLIFNDMRPFIDSRRGLYSRRFRDRYAAMMRPDPALLAATLTRYRIRWTLLAAGSPAAHAMDGISGWHRIYGDRWAVVHVRNTP